MALTRRQTEVLDFIRSHIEDKGFSPTLDEIAAVFSVRAVTIFEHVKELERKGVIRTERNRARSIEIVEDVADADPRVALVGRIAAGLPIEAAEKKEPFAFDGFFPGGHGDCYILEVKGQSMIDDHILDGDYVIVERRDTARSGETVVALIGDNSATLKRFYPEADHVRLEPANSTMKPIIVPRQDVRIQGIVTGVMRRY